MSTSTSLVTPSTESHSPWIPLEIISLILAMLWEALQTRQERRAFRNFALVSRAWLPLLAFITSRDVHISSIRSASAFLRLLPEGAPAVGCETVDMFSREAHRVARQICHSLTIHAGRVTWPYDTDSTADVLGAVTQTYLGSLPNLRHVSLRYANRDCDHILVHIMQGLFPPQVTHLSLTYPFTTPAKFPPFIPLAPGVFMNEVAPNVRHLALSNVATTFVTAMLRLGPNTETLELTNPSPLLPLSASPFPPALRTLVLHHPGVASSKKTMRA